MLLIRYNPVARALYMLIRDSPPAEILPHAAAAAAATAAIGNIARARFIECFSSHDIASSSFFSCFFLERLERV